MALLRLSTAKYQYSCDRCSGVIARGRPYYRLEPFPMARMKGTARVEHLCVACIRGEERDEVNLETRDSLRYYWVGGGDALSQQKSLLDHEPITVVQTEVHVVNVTADVLRALITDPNRIYQLTPDAFEELICDRLQAMDFGFERIGGHIFRKDGGIDIVAWPKKIEFPFFMAIQAKHHRSPKQKTGPGPVRELLGVIHSHPFNAGVLVTNTTFTPDARWAAQQQAILMKLRDIHDIQRWLVNDFLDEYDWQEIPEQITVCPGVIIPLARSKAFRK